MSAHVLVVDDDFDLAEALQTILEVHGYEASIAHDGREALESVDKRMPSLIILDMLMPTMDGWAFAREFALRHQHAAPILVVSAAENARERASAISADDVLDKPFDIHKLLAIVGRLTKQKPSEVTRW